MTSNEVLNDKYYMNWLRLKT